MKPFPPSTWPSPAHTLQRNPQHEHKPRNPALLTNKSSRYLSVAAASPSESSSSPLLCMLQETTTDWLSPTTAARTPQASSPGRWWIVGGEPGWLAPDTRELFAMNHPKRDCTRVSAQGIPTTLSLCSPPVGLTNAPGLKLTR